MSLIGDALRKTRQEAADRDSDRKGVLFSAKIAERPTRSGLGLGLVLGAVIAVFATVAGGGAVWWVLNQRTPEPQASETTDSNTEPDFDRGVGLAPLSASPAAGDSATGQRQAPGRNAVTVSAPTTEPDTESVSDADTATETGADTETDTDTDTDTDTASAPETGFVGKEDGADVYLMEATVGGVVLSLDYIVFRETDPYAEINGTEVHIGGTVAGFRVKSVERDRVVLSDGRRTIALRAP